MTISSVFIRRPRLAFVVSTVISIAGLIAMTVLPVAQFPDIVPPQVRVSAVYPGASSQAVEESVAQVIEAQVNGVERMLYMKSTSGGDGSYNLTVSFEVGSDPDFNTVNVTNRVNQALAQLPPEVQRNGVTTRKQSSALLQRAAVRGARGKLKAIARVEVGPRTSDSIGRYNGNPAAGIQTFQLPGANALATAQGVRKALKELESRFPDDVAYDVMYDTTVFVQ